MNQIAQPNPRDSGASADHVDGGSGYGVQVIASPWRRVSAAFVDWTIAGAVGCSTNCVIG